MAVEFRDLESVRRAARARPPLPVAVAAAGDPRTVCVAAARIPSSGDAAGPGDVAQGAQTGSMIGEVPLAFDDAILQGSTPIKGIRSEVSGRVDILSPKASGDPGS